MKFLHLLLTVLLSVVLSVGAMRIVGTQDMTSTGAKESVFDRVMRTKTLRCGYIVYDPIIRKDPNTGALSGIMVDAVEEMGKRLDWKIEWPEELSYVTHMEGLRSNRYDMVCTAFWGFPDTTKITELVGPFLFEPISVWTRPDDHRFDKDLSLIDDPSVTVSGVDGTFPAQEAKAFFPKAKLASLPQTSDYAAPLMDVATGKADVTFINNSMGLAFDQHNPGKIRNITEETPFRIFPIYAVIPKGEMALQALLNSVINLMQNDGAMERIIKKYEPAQGAYRRVAHPYR